MFDVIEITKLGEFNAVQFEVTLSCVCDLPPLFYFVYQHIINLTNVEQIDSNRNQSVAQEGNDHQQPLIQSPASTASNPGTVVMLEAG